MSPKGDLQAWDGEICGEKYLIMPYCTRSFKRRWMLVQTMLHELLRLICSYWHESFDISMDICRDFLYTHMDINFFHMNIVIFLHERCWIPISSFSLIYPEWRPIDIQHFTYYSWYQQHYFVLRNIMKE